LFPADKLASDARAEPGAGGGGIRLQSSSAWTVLTRWTSWPIASAGPAGP
jgi:hypothetical protein